MWNNKQQKAWDDIKNLWNKSSHNKEIKAMMSQFAIESNKHISSFEKNVIKNDIKLIKESINQREKESIKKDVVLIKQNVSQFESNLLSSGIAFIISAIKKGIKLQKNKE